jgi:hypothetical protein
VKYAFIRAQQGRHALDRLCRLLGVSRSGYHAWRDRAPRERASSDARLIAHIQRVHREHRQAYGAVKTWRALNAQGIACGKHRVARLRRQGHIEARRTERTRLTVEHHKSAAPSAPRCLIGCGPAT